MAYRVFGLAAVLLIVGAEQVFAQLTPAEQRIQDSLRSIETYQQQQRLNEVELRVFELEQQQRTRANQRTLDEQEVRLNNFTPIQIIPPAPPSTVTIVREVEAANARREDALAASDARLRALADQINN